MATLKTLAQELGLSVMAVSKALRDAPDISARTKERVRACAAKHHYTPNLAAQNLRRQRSGLLGVVLPNIHHTYYSHLAWGVERAAETAGYQLLLAHSLDRADEEEAQVRRLAARRVEGILMVPVPRWQHRFTSIEIASTGRIPLVLLDRFPAGVERFANVATVVHDGQRGIELAVEHLASLGHERILYLAGPQGSSASAARLTGFQKAMAKHSPANPEELTLLAGQNIPDGEAAMAKVLDEGIPATAVVTFNDSVALGAMNCLQRQGLRVPEDVSVTGMGDGLLAAQYRVPLTTVRLAKAEMGSEAVKSLLELIGKARPEPRVLPVELLPRASTGPAPERCAWA
ncbi:MAG: LacI family DNA-binding transcriptional regulator [Verrucomicrobiota bacterium]